VILFDPLVVYYSFCLDGDLSSECHSLHFVSRDHKIVIFSNLCKFIYCCLEILFRFFKELFGHRQKGVGI